MTISTRDMNKKSQTFTFLIVSILSSLVYVGNGWASTVHSGNSGPLADFDHPKAKNITTGFTFKVNDSKPLFVAEDEHENKRGERENDEREHENREGEHAHEEGNFVPLPAALPLLISGLAIIGLSVRCRAFDTTL